MNRPHRRLSRGSNNRERLEIPTLLIPIHLPKPGKSEQSTILPAKPKRNLPAARDLLPFIKPICKHQTPPIKKIIPEGLLLLQRLRPYIDKPITPESTHPRPLDPPPHRKNLVRGFIQDNWQLLRRSRVIPRHIGKRKTSRRIPLQFLALNSNRIPPAHTSRVATLQN